MELKQRKEGIGDSLRIVKGLAEKLVNDGFQVLANHPEWQDGTPLPVFGVTPDVLASRGKQRYTFLIEDERCLLHTEVLKQRIETLLKLPRLNLYVIVPAEIRWQGRTINPVRHIRERLHKWGSNVKIGTYDYKSETFNFNPWKD